MKRIMSTLVVVLMLSLFTSSFNGMAASLPLRVVVDGEKVYFPDAQPFIDSKQRVQLPVRFVSEALGAKVLWDGKAKKATISLDGKTMGVTIGKKSYVVNGKTKQMDTAALFKQSRTFVPLRFIYEGLGVSTQWDDAVKTVYISTKGDVPLPTTKPAASNSSGSKEVTLEGFKIPYTEMGDNLDPVYLTPSKLTVFENGNASNTKYLFQITISFGLEGADPVKAADEAEAILKQKLEPAAVNSIMNYVRSKTSRDGELPYKEFLDKTYRVRVESRYWGDVNIGVHKR